MWIRNAQRANFHLYLIFSMLVFSCAPEDFEVYDDPQVPDEIPVPPVAEKHMALQSIFDTIDFAVSLNKELCDVATSNYDPVTVTCRSPYSGYVVFYGVMTQKETDLSIMKPDTKGIQRDLKISKLEFHNYVYGKGIRTSLAWIPSQASQAVTIHGVGSAFIKKQEIVGMADTSLSTGGVYRGSFNVQWTYNQQNYEYLIEFDQLAGFYYRKEMVPTLTNNKGYDFDFSKDKTSLLLSLNYSGRYRLNQQKYNYQDIFIASMPLEQFIP